MASLIPFLLFLLISILSRLPSLASATCSGKQSYILNMEMKFTRRTLPSLPEKTSIPVILAVAHTEDYILFRKERRLTDSVAEVARTGQDRMLVRELDKLKDEGKVRSYFVLNDVPRDDLAQLELILQDDITRISIMAQLSPSPGWFVGVESVDLCDQNESRFVLERRDIPLENLNAGVDAGQSFEAESNPYPEGETRPVDVVVDIGPGIEFADLNIVQGKLSGFDWWKILLIVLVVVAVFVILIFFIYPRFRKRRSSEVLLTPQDGVEW